MKTSIYGVVLAGTVALGSVVQADELKISHVRPQDTTVDKEIRVFAEAVDKATGGNVTIRVFPALPRTHLFPALITPREH